VDGIAYNQRAGSFDFIPHAMTELTKNEISWRISDHYPIWAEFRRADHPGFTPPGRTRATGANHRRAAIIP
jgi:hypothetical protein